jgi:ABC-type nickel/cobalt efflux system permease component RcnA
VASCGKKDDIDAILYLIVKVMLMEKVDSHGVDNAHGDDNAHGENEAHCDDNTHVYDNAHGHHNAHNDNNAVMMFLLICE